MKSIYKRVLTFAFWTLFQQLAATTSTSAASKASENCSEKCGNMTIPYPFGIKEGCFHNGFQIHCNETAGTTILFTNVEIKDISLSQAQMRVYNWISYSCYFLKGHYVDFQNYLGLGSSSAYRISHKRNKFIAVGCNTFATLYDPYDFTITPIERNSYQRKCVYDMHGYVDMDMCTEMHRVGSVMMVAF